MKTIAVINLKGGVGKSVTTVNVAYDLTALDPARRVLVVDLDKQANTTKFFDRLSYDKPCAADVLTMQKTADAAIRDTDFRNLFILPANMTMLTANKLVLMDCTHPQQNRLRKALRAENVEYDYCLIDCPPDIDMATINALTAADYVIIPVDCDEWALDGLAQISDQVEAIRDAYNPALQVLGCLATKYLYNNYSNDTLAQLAKSGLPVFSHVIRYTVKVKKAKSEHKPVQCLAPKCTAAVDYMALTKEIVAGVSSLDTQEV